MRVIRCFSPTLEAIGNKVQLSPEESLHLVKVLRLKVGDLIEILNGKGEIASAIITEIIHEKRLIFVIAEITKRISISEPALKTHLFLAAPKGKLMTQIIRDATELGVWHIHPILCHYSVVDLSEKDLDSLWHNHAVEACKQSGNPFLPFFSPMIKFEEAIKTTHMQGFFGAVPEYSSFSSSHTNHKGDIALWIGPEGGFSSEEHALLIEKDMIPITAGQWILRVETAVTALLGILSNHSIQN